MIKVILYAILAAIFVFLLFAFGNATIDSSKWSNDGRGLCAVFMGVMVFIIPLAYACIMFLNKPNKEQEKRDAKSEIDRKASVDELAQETDFRHSLPFRYKNFF